MYYLYNYIIILYYINCIKCKGLYEILIFMKSLQVKILKPIRVSAIL
jgi:hypothetical protein